MIATLKQTGADIVLGLFPTEHASIMDTVRSDRSGRVESILVKPVVAPPGYERTWMNAVWRPHFGDFLARQLGTSRPATRGQEPRALHQ
jgi:glucose-1-phosphate thymidylyltransferase